ncbi:MAG: Ldh family oxidoreductase [Hyphomicrobiaceae bacterium]
MAHYPGEASERRIRQAALETAVGQLFGACGMSDKDAATLARSLVHADLRGIHSHGVLRVPDYVAKMTREGVNPTGRPKVISDRGGAIVVDGDNAMGQIAGQFAMQLAIDRARSVNIAFAAVRGSNHCGALDWYTMQALDHDMIGIAGSNALPTMAPWGGVDKIVGLNPVSVAFPSGATRPFVIDVALGATAHGKIRVYAQKGHAIPDGWAFDAAGQPTTDAEAALDGLIQPIGGHKGIGLAMVVGILSSVLSGAGYGTESGNMVDGATAGADGQFYMAINVAGFREIGDFKAHMDRIAMQYLESRRATEEAPLYLPGGIEAEITERHRRDGIPLNDETIALIAAAGRQLDVDLAAFLGGLN